VTTAVLELEAGRSTYFAGPWHNWRREKAARLSAATTTAQRIDVDIVRLERFVERFRAKKNLAKRAQAKLTHIGRLEKERAEVRGEISLLTRRAKSLGFEFLQPKRSGRTVVEADDGELAAGDKELLSGVSFAVERGDFYPGTVAAARFPERAGWFVGTSGEDEARADGESTTSWASTIAYADEWNALPPFNTLERLPRDGVVIWIGLSRTNRFPPRQEGDQTFPTRTPPFSLDDFDARGGWEGQLRDLPEYLLLATVRGQYDVDLRVYFGRPDPTEAMRAEAQAMFDGLELPDWGPWETQ